MEARSDRAATTTAELGEMARAAIAELAARAGDEQVFAELLEIGRVTGDAIGTAARRLAAERSWAQVGAIAGTSRQAAWERWHPRGRAATEE